MIYVTGDTHGEQGRFLYVLNAIDRTLAKNDTLIICGDFQYLYFNSAEEHLFLDYLAERPYQILFVDGNHENFDALYKIPIETWNGGKVHILRKDANDKPKVIHLLRGQIFLIDNTSVFTFGGAHSIDTKRRVLHRTWWEQEMPTDDEMKEAITNLKSNHFKVDYIITHTAPEDTMTMFRPNHPEEKRLNNFLEWVRETVVYKQWYFGHLHMDRKLYRNQTAIHFDLRNIETNEVIEYE